MFPSHDEKYFQGWPTTIDGKIEFYHLKTNTKTISYKKYT